MCYTTCERPIRYLHSSYELYIQRPKTKYHRRLLESWTIPIILPAASSLSNWLHSFIACIHYLFLIICCMFRAYFWVNNNYLLQISSGGVYLYDEDDQRDLFHLLLTHCVASNHTRGSFKTLQQKTIDFKASCFCHGKPHEFMYMCPVCLSLICSQKYDELMKSDNPACITCEVPLNLKSNANSNKRSRI